MESVYIPMKKEMANKNLAHTADEIYSIIEINELRNYTGKLMKLEIFVSLY